MRVGRVEPHGAQRGRLVGFGVVEYVYKLGVVQVPGLEQHRHLASEREFACYLRQLLLSGDLASEQNLRFGDIRSDDPHKRYQLFLERGDRFFLQEPIAGGGDHHRIKDDVADIVCGQGLPYGPDQFR